MDIAAKILANEKELSLAWGRSLPELSDAILNDANRAFDLDLEDKESALLKGGSGHWLGRLAVAWLENRDERYPKAAAAVFKYVLKKEPLVSGRWLPPDNYDVLVIPHRIGDTECVGWLGALPWFIEHEDFSGELPGEIISSVQAQLNYLADNLHEGRNIRVTQGDSLLSTGLRLSFLPEAEYWRQTGLDVLNDSFHRMIRPDGSSAEATGWYHYIVMNMGFRFWRLGQAMPELGIQITSELVERMFDYTSACVEPDGRQATIGDCTRSRIGSDGTLKSVLGRRAEARRILGLSDKPLPLSQNFPNTGQSFLRDGWGPDNTYLTFDATKRHGYHWHPSCNSIQVYSKGRHILMDPGRLSYNGSSPHRQYAISTRGHSTCNLNGWNQTWTESRFRARQAEGYDVIDAHYEGGYWPGTDEFNPTPGIFGQHHRTLLWLRGRFVVILDHVHHRHQADTAPDVECNWQFGPGEVRLSGSNSVIAKQGVAQHMLLFPVTPDGTKLSIHEGEENPHFGWVSDDRDEPTVSPLVRSCAEKCMTRHAHFASVLIPFDHQLPEVCVDGAGQVMNGRVQWFRLAWPDGSTDEFWWYRNLEYPIQEQDEFVTDASLVHLHKEAQGASTVLAVDGTYLRPLTVETLEKPGTFVVRPMSSTAS